MITAWEYTPYPLVPSLPQDHPIPLGSPPSTVPSMGWMSYREARVLWVVQGIVGKGTQEYMGIRLPMVLYELLPGSIYPYLYRYPYYTLLPIQRGYHGY